MQEDVRRECEELKKKVMLLERENKRLTLELEKYVSI